MGTWSDPWLQGPPSAQLQAAQQDISVKNREKSDSGILKEIVAAWREKFGPHATTQRRNERKNTMTDENL